MFLHLLNETEQQCFIRLASQIVLCDKEFSSEEKSIMNEYYRELGISDFKLDEIDGDLSDILAGFKNSTKEIKNYVYLEILALILSDEKFQEQEKDLLAQMERDFEIDESKRSHFIDAINDMNAVYRRIYKLVKN